MTLPPYRAVAEVTPPAPPTLEERLGPLRSTHPAQIKPQLLAAGVTAGFLLLFGGAMVPTLGAAVLAVAAPLSLLAFAIVGGSALRARGVNVHLYAGGLVVERRAGRDVVLFEEVDEVWYELDPTSTPVGRYAWLRAMRLVDHDRRAHRVPLAVREPVRLVRWVERRCSEPLLAEARRALAHGDTLTFGPARLTRERLSIGKASVRWGELRQVRLQSGRVAFFRRWPVFPWRTVGHERVPHPSVFVQLVRDLAPHVEIDNPPGVEDAAGSGRR